MITADLKGFLESGISIHIATRNDRLEPLGGRVVAAHVEDDGSKVTAFLPEASAPPIMANLRANQQAALVFGRPSDNRACQLKGVFLAERPAVANERPLTVRQWEGFLADLSKIGFAPELTSDWKTWPLVAITIQVMSIFDQTPGPGAGAPIPGAGPK